MARMTEAELERILRARRERGVAEDPSTLAIATGTAAAAAKKRRGVLNGLERDYLARVSTLIALGELRDVLEHESIALRIANGAQFRPDFPVVALDNVLEFHEVKGFWREAARVRIKAAASIYPCFRFFGVRRIDGAWQYERFVS